jgi:hypothetical protein
MATSWNSVLPHTAVPAARFVPLDPSDFAKRHWVPNSGWPIDERDLAPFLDAAWRRCGVEPVDFFADPLGGPPPLVTPGGELVTRLDQLAAASVFTRSLTQRVVSAPDARVIVNVAAAQVTPAHVAESRRTEVEARSRASQFTVRSRAVVLAAGAIENARLLLASTSSEAGGLGNRFDNVGRYFMDHPRVGLGYGAFLPGAGPERLGLYEPHVQGKQIVIGKLRLAADVMHRERLLGGVAQLVPHGLSVRHLHAIDAARDAKQAMQRRDAKAVLRSGARPLRSSPALLRYTWHIRHPGRTQLALPGSDRWTGTGARSFKLNFQPEQVPQRANRVTLAAHEDDLGRCGIRLLWRCHTRTSTA